MKDDINRYELAGGNKKFTCPICGSESLRRYCDKMNKYKYLDKVFGKCQECNYHNGPK